MKGSSFLFKRPTQRKRAHHHHHHHPGNSVHNVTLGVGVICVGVAWVVFLYTFSYSMIEKRMQPRLTQIIKGYPIGRIDLWPDDSQDKALKDSLRDCLPNDEISDCKLQFDPTRKPRIGILRPPGVFGNIFDEFVNNVVNQIKESYLFDSIDYVSTIDVSHNYTKIVRLVTLPILLESLDLIYSTNPTHEVSSDDLISTVRILIQWHCRLSEIAKTTPLLTISLSEALLSRNNIIEVMVDFLVESSSPKDVQAIGKQRLRFQALQRIDECSDFLSIIQETDPFLKERMDEAIHDELSQDDCGSNRVFAGSRSTQLIQDFLDTNNEKATQRCRDEPTLPICK